MGRADVVRADKVCADEGRTVRADVGRLYSFRRLRRCGVGASRPEKVAEGGRGSTSFPLDPASFIGAC